MSVQASLIFSLVRRNQKLVVRVTKTVNTGLHPVPGWRRYSRILIVLVEKWHVVNDPKFYRDTDEIDVLFEKRIYLEIQIFLQKVNIFSQSIKRSFRFISFPETRA